MRERPSGIRVVVTLASGTLDFDAWAARYVRAILEADRLAQQKQAEAA